MAVTNLNLFFTITYCGESLENIFYILTILQKLSVGQYE